MTKFTKRVFAMLLTLTLILSPAGTVATATSLFPGTGDEIISSNFNELSVRNAVRTYFDQREAYLLGTAETIVNVNPGIIPDEDAHREAIASSGFERISSDITIDSVICWDTNADVVVTETVTFSQDGAYLSETIVHTLLLGQQDDGSIWVAYDGYLEDMTGFRSCSYVPSEDIVTSITTITSYGSEACFIAVAQNEVGYAEQGNNITKYGNTPGNGWCASFVSWCANKADILSVTIPQVTAPEQFRTYYEPHGRFYLRTSGYVPQPGDIYFGTEDGVNISHCGIVYDVDADNVYTIDGNWSNKVQLRTMSRNCSYIFGYGNPNYTETGHYYSTYKNLNTTYHNICCEHCDTVLRQEKHTIITGTWYSDDSRHWNQCVCGRKGTLYIHIFEYDSSIHKEVCVICGRTEMVL